MYVADMHCDTISELYKRRRQGEQDGLGVNCLRVDVEKLKRGGYLLQNFAVFVDTKEEQERPYQCAKNQIALFYEEMEKNADRIRPAKTVQEIERNQKDGIISAVLTMEEGEICEGSLAKLEEFYRAGVRMMTFTWNYENSLGTKQGLTELGIAFLKRMEELGMIADVSHLPDAGFFDVCRYAKKPFVASHSNARALCGHKRNLTDDMIRMIAKRGGVIGINYYGMFLEDCADGSVCKSKVSKIADHICHMIRAGGISCVGLGSDFDGFVCETEISDCAEIGMLWEEMRRRGISDHDIEAVFFRNAERVYRECWK